MGYYTDYNLTAWKNRIQRVDIPEEVVKDLLEVGMDVEGTWSYGNCKWYDSDKDVQRFSSQFPDLYWQLDGDGEEQGDIWSKVWKNGRLIAAWKADGYPTLAEMLDDYPVLSQKEEK